MGFTSELNMASQLRLEKIKKCEYEHGYWTTLPNHPLKRTKFGSLSKAVG